jgi:hypothetical protein
MAVQRSNPYATTRTARESGLPDNEPPEQQYNAYAVPGLTEENGYADSPVTAWGPTLRTSPMGFPDGSRLGETPRRDYRPDPAKPPEEGFWRLMDADRAIRYGESEDVDGNGWNENKFGAGGPDPSSNVYVRWAPNPRATPPPEPRVTSSLVPRTYSYTRPFDQLNRPFPDVVAGTARRFLGLHFSMADHRRNYEILGMAPQRMPGNGTRNTYRLDPVPWDANIQDRAEPAPPVSRVLTQREVPAPVSRSYRLM